MSVIESLPPSLKRDSLIVGESTVPVDTAGQLAVAIFFSTGLTVDVGNSDFDFPRPVTFLLAGIAIGLFDRRKRWQEVAADDFAGQLRQRHA
jgi:hypothetical protein